MEVCPPLCSALTEGKDRATQKGSMNLHRDSNHVSRQLSRFYLSHTSLIGTSYHSLSSSMARLIP